MTARVVFFSNPQSHSVQKNGSRLKAFREKYPQSCDIALTAQSPQQTEQAFKTIAFTPQDHLCIEGGDGTVQRSLSALLNSLNHAKDCPKISIIPGGLTNQIAANIGLKSARDQHIKAALSAPQTGLHPTPVLHVQSQEAAPLFGCLFSSGAMPFVTQYYEAQIRAHNAGGQAAIAATLLKVMSGKRAERDKVMPPTELSLTVKSQDQTRQKTGPHLGTIVTTLPSLMMGLDPFWNDGTSGPLRLLYASGESRRLLRNLAGLWLGQKPKDRSADGLESYRADHLDFHYGGPLVLDGELLDFGGAPFSISATPPLPFVTGRKP